MSLDLKNARAAIKTRVLLVSDVTMVHTTKLPAGVTPDTDAFGRMSMYGLTGFGRPVPSYGKTLADGEQDYPHLWPVSVTLVGIDADAIQDAADELDALILDWQPDGDNSTGFTGAAAYSYAIPSTENTPAREELHRFYTCLVNMTRS